MLILYSPLFWVMTSCHTFFISAYGNIVAAQTCTGKGPTHVRFGSKADIWRLQQKSCPLYPQKRTYAVQEPMSALGQ